MFACHRDGAQVRIHAAMTTRATVNITSRPPDPPAPLDDRLLRLFADPLRARLVTLLTTEQLCTCHLATATGSLPSAVSNQLRHLREAGVVEREAAGRFTYYRLRPEALEELGAQFQALAAAARAAEKRPC
jgi:ArsR family transcriptional regulator